MQKFSHGFIEEMIAQDIHSIVERLIHEPTPSPGFVQEVESQLLEKLLDREKEDIPPYFIARLREMIPPLTLSRPLGPQKVPPARQALSTGLGVFLGAVLLRPFFLATGMDPGTSLFLSCLLGAVLFVFFLNSLTASPFLRRGLLVATGIGTMAQLLALAVNPFRSLPGLRLPNQRWKRFLFYLLLPLLYFMSAPREEVHQEEVQAGVERTLFLWTYCSWHLLQLALQEQKEKKPPSSYEEEMQTLLPSLYQLYHTPGEELETGVLEIFQVLRSFGYEELTVEGAFLEKNKKPLSLVWREDLQEKYHVFGQIQEGEQVRIEKPVITKGGEVLVKGLVRRVKKTISPLKGGG